MSIAGGPAHRLALTSRARSHRPALALALFLLIALALPTVASSQVEETETDGASVPTSIPGPEAFAALDTGQAPEPESTEADRDESATAHTDLSSGQALALLGQEFEEALVAQPIPELDLSGGRSVERYLGPNSALIDVPESAADLMVEGTSPLRAPENGAPAPLDGDLVAEGDHFEVSNAPVEAELPAELPDGVAFDELGVEVAPVTSEPVGAVPVDDKLFYPNFSDAAADTDVLITPTSHGADISFQLRSEGSPERLALEFSIPEGATLGTSADGGAAVSTADGTDLLTISPAFAWDAEGTSVSVSYEVVDNHLELSVAHQGRDLLYPLIVDPLVEHDLLDRASGRDPLWNWYSSQPGFTWSHEPDGLQSAARAGYTYPNAYDNAQWVLSHLRDSTIEQITYQSFFRYNGSNNLSPPACMTIGLWSRVTNWWEPGTVVDAWGNQHGAGGGAAEEICGSANYDWRDVWVGPHREVGDVQTTNRNIAIFSLFTPPCCTGYRWDTAYHRLNEVWIYRYDYESPSASFQSAPTESWRDDGNATQNLTAFGIDEGLGVNRFELSGPGINPQTGGNVVTPDAHPCTGQRGSRCPGYEGWAQQIAYKLREGRSDLTLHSYDIIGRRSDPAPLIQRIDRSDPVVPGPTGSLADQAAHILTTNDYQLTASATDGSGSGATQTRSGVSKLGFFVAGETSPRHVVHQTGCDPALRSCPTSLSGTWSIEAGELPVGTYDIRVVATDAVNHQRTVTLRITVRDDPDEPVVTLQAGTPAPDGSYELTITATDPTPQGYASGVVHLETFVDGQRVDIVDQECPNSGCSLTRKRQMSAAQSPSQHEISAIVYDRAGNSAVEYIGEITGRFPFFGYNQGWDGPRMQKALDGGANVIKFAVDWCDIEPNPGSPPVRDWSGTDALFHLVHAHNTNRDEQTGQPITTDDLQTIPVLSNAPNWARHDDEPEGCGTTTPPARNSAGINAWKAFVSAFVDRYRPNGSEVDGAIRAIEAWNEPNLPLFWMGALHQRQPGRFGELVNAAADASSLPVFPGALSPVEGADPEIAFMQDAANTIAPEKIDGISIHLFANTTPNNRKAVEKVVGQYSEMIQKGLPQTSQWQSKSRWITEIGFLSDHDNHPYATISTQRQRLREAYKRLGRKQNLRSFIVHTLEDQIGSPRDFGVIRDANSPSDPKAKKIYCLLADRTLSPGEPRPACTQN